MLVKLSISLAMVVLTLIGHTPKTYPAAVFIRTASGLSGIRATASLGSVLGTSDREGRIVFQKVPPGSYELLVTPEPPFHSFRWIVKVPQDQPAIFRLERPR